MFQLREWYLELYHEKTIAHGYCYYNPRFPSGCPVHTSPVLEIETDEEKRQWRFLTRSGSCYAADMADINEHYIENTKKVFQKRNIPFDEKKYLELKQQLRDRIINTYIENKRDGKKAPEGKE